MKSNALQQEIQQTARIVGHMELPQLVEDIRNISNPDDFLSSQAAVPWEADALRRDLDRIKAEISELRNENRWQDILVLLHPIAEKWPELCDSGLDSELIRESAFVLCRVGKYEEAMAVVKPLTVSEPENVMAWYNLGYAAYEALYAAKENRSIMPPAKRRQLIDTAHHAFGQCQQLRPDSIAFFYRDAMICKDFENKPRQAVPLFEYAITNYEKLSREERQNIHQQRPKYIRSMYHLASCMLKIGQPNTSKTLLEKVLSEDSKRDHMSPVFKHFALAKTLHALGSIKAALDHLQTATVRATKRESIDFVHELAARCALLLGQHEQAAQYIECIHIKRRRPYIRWTEADVLIAQGCFRSAIQVLEKSAERDRRSCHKSLLRIARIYVTESKYEKGLDAASRANTFCLNTYGNGFGEAKFWQAACLYRLERYDEAGKIASDLSRSNFSYPNFKRLTALIHERRQIEKKPAISAPVVTLVK